eukprot:4239691-Pyramimonas_sp.AAC.1
MSPTVTPRLMRPIYPPLSSHFPSRPSPTISKLPHRQPPLGDLPKRRLALVGIRAQETLIPCVIGCTLLINFGRSE